MDQFLIQIFAVIHQIPRGKVTTYGEIAKLAGYPYARHVGKALGNLPKDSTLPGLGSSITKEKYRSKGENLARQRERY